jgi:hypothetical protein
MDFKDFPLKEVGRSVMLIGAVYADNDTAYCMVFPEYQGDAPPGEDVELTQDDWAALLRQGDLVETEVLAKAKDGKLVKAIIRKCQRQIAQQVSWNVYRRDGYECRYCGRNDVPLTVDHLVLWEDGGPSTEDNLVAACKKCNKVRGNTSYHDWLLHPYYKKRSRENLTEAQIAANHAILSRLDKVERVNHVRSR